jgi:hypothetical protein
MNSNFSMETRLDFNSRNNINVLRNQDNDITHNRKCIAVSCEVDIVAISQD